MTEVLSPVTGLCQKFRSSNACTRSVRGVVVLASCAPAHHSGRQGDRTEVPDLLSRGCLARVIVRQVTGVCTRVWGEELGRIGVQRGVLDPRLLPAAQGMALRNSSGAHSSVSTSTGTVGERELRGQCARDRSRSSARFCSRSCLSMCVCVCVTIETPSCTRPKGGRLKATRVFRRTPRAGGRRTGVPGSPHQGKC